mgnify:CR=1 FL=1
MRTGVVLHAQQWHLPFVVVQLLASKDAQIQTLTRENEAWKIRCAHLENALGAANQLQRTKASDHDGAFTAVSAGAVRWCVVTIAAVCSAPTAVPDGTAPGRKPATKVPGTVGCDTYDSRGHAVL